MVEVQMMNAAQNLSNLLSYDLTSVHLTIPLTRRSPMGIDPMTSDFRDMCINCCATWSQE
ncbi:hypothetical protein ACTXT7_013070 [Hymenolepis weldensis]